MGKRVTFSGAKGNFQQHDSGKPADIHLKSRPTTSFNPFLPLRDQIDQNQPEDPAHSAQSRPNCIIGVGSQNPGCFAEEHQQEAEKFFTPFNAAGQSWIGNVGEEEGRLDPGQVVRGQVGGWEEDGSINNAFAPDDKKAQQDWPRWGELVVADLGEEGEEMERSLRRGDSFQEETVLHQPLSFPVFPAKPSPVLNRPEMQAIAPSVVPPHQSPGPAQFVLPQIFTNALDITAESFTRKPKITTSPTTAMTTTTTTTRTTSTTATLTNTFPTATVVSTPMSPAISLIQCHRPRLAFKPGENLTRRELQ